MVAVLIAVMVSLTLAIVAAKPVQRNYLQRVAKKYSIRPLNL